MAHTRAYRYPCVVNDQGDDNYNNDVLGEFCKAGPEIVDELLTDESSRLLRGKNEIDKNCSDRILVGGTCKIRTWVQPGALTTIEDSQLGQKKGILKIFSLTVTRSGDNATATTGIRVERENT